MGLFDRPNKFIIETAVDLGIDNVKKSQNLSPEALKSEYEKAKKALHAGGESEEITSLYTRFIDLYEASLKASTQATTHLKEELQWKHLGDLREAVKNGGKGLSITEIEALNQYALAEYARQDRLDQSRIDEGVKVLLNKWFRMYETLKQKSLESMKVSYKDALRTAFLNASSLPFTFRYSEGNNILELSVNFKENKIIIGSKEHALIGEKIKVGSISMDKDKLYIPFTIDGKDATYSEPIKKQEFLDTYLQDILDGKDIRIQGNLVRVSRTGELRPRVLIESSPSPRSQVESQKENLSLDEAIKKGFMSLVSGQKSSPLTVLHDSKKYRFPLEIDKTSFTLGGKKFEVSFPSNVKNGSFVFEKDTIVFSGMMGGDRGAKKLFEVDKSILVGRLSGATNEIVFNSPDGDISITATGKGEYLPKENTISSQNQREGGQPVPPRPSESSTGPKPAIDLKYTIEAYAGWNAERLREVGKTIKDLQTELKKLKFYTGEVNGVFDIATLNAVVAFQKAKNLPLIDGLVGRYQTIPALFGISPPGNPPTPGASGGSNAPALPGSPQSGGPASGTIPGETRRTDGAPEPSRRPQGAPPVPSGREGATEAVPVVLKSLDAAMKNFRKVIADVSQKSGYIFDTPEEIKKSQTAVNESLKPVLSAIQSLEGKKLSAEEKAQYDRAVMEVSRYFSNDIDGVKNRHYRNHDLAFDLAFSLIQDDLKRQNITFKPRPTGDTVLASLERLDPKLHAKLKADLRNGYNLGQILSNPQVRSQYEKVYEKIYGEWENEMQALLKKLKENRPTLASIEGNAALNQMISIMGTTDFWDTKARTRDMLTQTAGMVGSTVAGVGAFMLTPVTGGTSAILGAALIGGGFSTLGMIATKGRAGWDKETLTELGVNVASFGFGGLAARTANIYIQSGKAIGIASGIALDATAGLAIGVIGDYARAWSLDTGIDLWPTIRNNLPWALLPIGLGMKGALRARAEHVKDTMDRARTQAKMGDIAGAQATIKQAEPEMTALAEEAKKIAPKEYAPVQSVTQNTQPSIKDTLGIEYARRQDGIYKKTPDAGSQWEKVDNAALTPEIKAQLERSPIAASVAPTYKDGTYALSNGDTLTVKDGRYTRFDSNGVEQGRGELAGLEQALRDKKIYFADPTVRSEVPPASAPKPDAPGAQGRSPGTPEGAHQGHSSQIEPQIRGFVPTSKDIDKSLKNLFNGARTSKVPIDYGPYKIQQHTDGKQVRVTGDGVDFILPPKKAQEKLKEILLSKPAEASQAIEHQIQEGLKSWKPGLTREYKHEGNTYVFSRPKEGGGLVVTDKKTGRVLSEGEINQIALANKLQHMKNDTAELVAKFGHEKIFTKIGPDTFAIKLWKREWNGGWTLYNWPIKGTAIGIEKIVNLTLNQVIAQPAMTLQSFYATATTSNSIKGIAVNASRALLIKDVNREVTMGSILSAHAFPLAATFGLTAWGYIDFDGKGARKEGNPNDILISYLSMFYGGLLVGGIGSHILTDTQPLTWKIGAEKGDAKASPPPAVVTEGETTAEPA